MADIKETLFTYEDLTGSKKSQLSVENIMLDQGMRSKTLMGNKIFQEAVKDLYVALIQAEDEESVDVRFDREKIESYRIQRRLLRQVLANLDNRILHFEQLEEQRQYDAEMSKVNEGGEL